MFGGASGKKSILSCLSSIDVKIRGLDSSHGLREPWSRWTIQNIPWKWSQPRGNKTWHLRWPINFHLKIALYSIWMKFFSTLIWIGFLSFTIEIMLTNIVHCCTDILVYNGGLFEVKISFLKSSHISNWMIMSIWVFLVM